MIFKNNEASSRKKPQKDGAYQTLVIAIAASITVMYSTRYGHHRVGVRSFCCCCCWKIQRVRGGETVRKTVRRRPTSSGEPRQWPWLTYQFPRPCTITKRQTNFSNFMRFSLPIRFFIFPTKDNEKLNKYILFFYFFVAF